MHDGGRRAVLWALAANSGIAIAKFIGYALTGAASMLAESIHSVADTGNQALLLYGGHSAQRAPTPEHSFGYGRERYFYAFVVALVMFALGSLFAIFEGVDKLRHPHELNSPLIAVAILVVASILEALAFANAVREARRVRGKATWWAFLRNSKSPELPVVLLEDFGALIGLLFALTGIGLAQLTGDPRFDSLGSIAIGILLGAIAVFLAIEMKSLLIGESVSPATREKIVRSIKTTPGVLDLVHLRTQHLGPDEILVGAKVALDPSFEFVQVAAKIDEIEGGIRAEVPEARIIYIEPDVLRTGAPDDADPDPTPS